MTLRAIARVEPDLPCLPSYICLASSNTALTTSTQQNVLC